VGSEVASSDTPPRVMLHDATSACDPGANPTIERFFGDCVYG
jgi:hypothetical protein